MVEVLKVYMDHHIARDDLLYKRSNEKVSPNTSHDPQPFLRLKDLCGEKSMDRVLRKPDFQRATWAWSPPECVSLLESFVKEQVIPSIIMWLSPGKRWYVLDGGHRISVVLAWLRDDWGDKVPSQVFQGDAELEASVRDAADEVRSLLIKKNIGKFEDYGLAFERSENLAEECSDFEEEMDGETAERVAFYRSFLSGSIGFPLQWVKGDYEKAEESFLKINTGGRSLTEWEIKLVKNRNSSFARVVMSISDITRAEHCWPTRVDEKTNRSQVKQNVNEILQGVTNLHRILFEPIADSLSEKLQQPLFNESRLEPDKKPAYLAELFTVIEGGKGRETQTERLLKQDREASPQELISNGLKLIKESQEILNHLVGNSSQSLALVPSIYFYSENGKHVRSLLYGFLYWLFTMNDAEITFKRKLLFSSYRNSFEQVLITKKKELVNNFSRRGSGSEITVQIANYYQDFLALLIKYDGHVKSEAFVEEYEELFGQKSVTAIRSSFTEKLSRCSVCMGIVDIIKDAWFDQREINTHANTLTHPFCSANRLRIESIQNDQSLIELPSLTRTKPSEKLTQLSFLDFENIYAN